MLIDIPPKCFPLTGRFEFRVEDGELMCYCWYTSIRRKASILRGDQYLAVAYGNLGHTAYIGLSKDWIMRTIETIQRDLHKLVVVDCNGRTGRVKWRDGKFNDVACTVGKRHHNVTDWQLVDDQPVGRKFFFWVVQFR